MVFSVQSCALLGIEPHPVLCEVDLSNQLPTFTLVGLPSSLTQESRERIRAAVVNSGLDWPARKITVNLLPANLPKWGSHFELAMALGVLGAAAENREMPVNVFAVGELSLSGHLRACGWLSTVARWLLESARRTLQNVGEPLVLLAHPDDVRQLLAVAPELAHACELCPVETLQASFAALLEARVRLKQTPRLRAVPPEPSPPIGVEPSLKTLAEVQGEPLGVLAALVAIARPHHCLFVGQHGMGKSMLLRAIAEASKPLSDDERRARQGFLGMFGEYFTANGDFPRPTVYLQTSVSRAALEGALLNSGQLLPGELTRAHLGLLVADELLEFHRDVIECLRQPLEEGIVRLQRAKFRTILPASFQFLASTNLCPCGYFATERHECRCGKVRLLDYLRKLSGPLADRFDLIVLIGTGRDGVKRPTRERDDANIRRVTVPVDLEARVAALLDPSSWESRLARVWGTQPDRAVPGNALEHGATAQSGASPTALVAVDVGSGAGDGQPSRRGRQKLISVGRTIAALLDEEPALAHVRMAQLLRQDIEYLIRPALRRFMVTPV